MREGGWCCVRCSEWTWCRVTLPRPIREGGCAEREGRRHWAPGTAACSCPGAASPSVLRPQAPAELSSQASVQPQLGGSGARDLDCRGRPGGRSPSPDIPTRGRPSPRGRGPGTGGAEGNGRCYSWRNPFLELGRRRGGTAAGVSALAQDPSLSLGVPAVRWLPGPASRPGQGPRGPLSLPQRRPPCGAQRAPGSRGHPAVCRGSPPPRQQAPSPPPASQTALTAPILESHQT